MVHNLNVVGGPVVAGSRVNVDYSTQPPTILAVGPETMTLEETKEALDQGLLQKPLGGGGGGDPYAFVPVIGGNLNGFYLTEHQNQRVFGGGPYRSATSGWDHFGIGFPYPVNGDDEWTGSDVYGTLVAHGIWIVPAGVTGFIATPLIRWKRRSGSSASALEVNHMVYDVSLRPNGEWRNGFYLYGETTGIVPFTSSLYLWSDTSGLAIDLQAGVDGPTGFVFDTLYPGLVIQFQFLDYDNTGDPGWAWIVGWLLQLF
jgi:hypothetical protein